MNWHTQFAQCSLVKYIIDPFAGFVAIVHIANISFNEFEIRQVVIGFDVLFKAGRQVVDHNNFSCIVFQQVFNNV